MCKILIISGVACKAANLSALQLVQLDHHCIVRCPELVERKTTVGGDHLIAKGQRAPPCRLMADTAIIKSPHSSAARRLVSDWLEGHDHKQRVCGPAKGVEECVDEEFHVRPVNGGDDRSMRIEK